MRFAIRILFVAGLAAFLLGPGAVSAWSRQVQINYTAEVVTVAGAPFGLAGARGKIMTGYFWYDTGTSDLLPNDPARGTYDHALPFAGFYGTLDGTTFMGSQTPRVQIENFSSSDTIRYFDGPDGAHPNRIISANGVPLATAQLTLAVTSDKNPLNGDRLPDPFPFSKSDPHTFSMSDKNGTMLLQFRTLTDAAPVTTPAIVSVTVRVSDKRARFLVDGGIYYASKIFQWPAGSSHIIDFPLNEDGRQYSQAQTSRWGFGGWSESTGLLETGRGTSFTVLAAADLEVVGAVGGFQHILQMNFFGDVVDLANPQGVVTSPAVCASPGLANPDTLRSGLVYMDGQCYWQSFRTWVSEGTHLFNAFPYPGFAFIGWLGGGQNLTAQARNVTVSDPMVLETRFTPARRVRFLTEPIGLQVTVDDVTVIPAPDVCPPLSVGTPASIKPPCVGEFDFAPNSVHKLIVPTPQRDRYGKGWVFDGFSNGMANDSSYTVGPITFNDNYDTLVANFVPGVNSIISSLPIGVSIEMNGKTMTSDYSVFKPGEQVQLSAPATAKVNGRTYTFLRWSQGGDRVQTATIPAEAGEAFNLTAVYDVESQILIDSRTPNASVLLNGERCALPCAVNGKQGEEARIEPAPSPSLSPTQKMEFLRWSDGGPTARIETLSGKESRILLAEFSNSFLLETGSDPGNGATFTTTPASADLFFPEGTKVTVTAKPKGGFTFNRWTGDAVGAQPAAELTLDRSRKAFATLDRVPYLADNPVRNAATNVAGPVAPGSVVAIVGESLAYEFVQGPASPLSQAIYGTSAAVDYYRFLPLRSVSPQRIEAVLPTDLTPGEHVILVRRSGFDDVVNKFTVSAVGPGLFQAVDDSASVLGYHADGTLITSANPAHGGEEITVLGTGFGPYRVPAVDGQALPEAPPYPLAADIEVMFGGARLDSATAAGQPGQTGVTSIRFRVPSTAAAGAMELKASVQGQESPALSVPIGAAEASTAAAPVADAPME